MLACSLFQASENISSLNWYDQLCWRLFR